MSGLVKRKEAGEILGISLPTLKKRTDEGRYNTVKQGKNLMYFRSDLESEEKPTKKISLPVPTLKDLVAGNISEELSRIQRKNKDFMILLNNEPPKDWVLQHPIIKVKNDKGVLVPYEYLSIKRVKYLLSRIFTKWWIEIKYAPQVLGNSVVMTVRLFTLNPVTNEVDFMDGSGACPIQLNAGSKAMDIHNMKSNAIAIAVPIAETYAIKDASKKIGKLFGGDLNGENIDYSTIIKKKEERTKEETTAVEIERLKQLIEASENLDHLQDIKDDIILTDNKKLFELLTIKAEELENKEEQ